MEISIPRSNIECQFLIAKLSPSPGWLTWYYLQFSQPASQPPPPHSPEKVYFPAIFRTTTLNFKRQPQFLLASFLMFFWKMKDDLNFWQMKDDLSSLQMKDNLNIIKCSGYLL
jgi:hypothetical protein